MKHRRHNKQHFLKDHFWIILNVIIIIILIIEVVIFFVMITRSHTQIALNDKTKTIVLSINSVSKQPDQKPSKSLPGFVSDYTIPPIQDGMAPIITNIPTSQSVVFLTIDDGAFKDQSVVDMIKQNSIKPSLFLAKTFIANNPDFFKQIVSLGALIEDHTINHDTNMVTTEDYDQQKAEICGMADYELEHYGRRPIFFRPPGGAYSSTMRRAAADCGMKAVVTWIAKANGGSMQYQIGNKLRPGDIVLMHFRPEFKQDMQAFIDAQNAAGLHTELLEDLVTG